MNPTFKRYIGIDYSGAQTPTSSIKGLRVYEADHLRTPQEVEPPPSPRKYWTRRGIADWLVARLSGGPLTLVGIDHGFSFPLRYFEQHGLPFDWPFFLDDFQRHWPTDEDHTYVDFVREGSCGNAAARSGNPHCRRITELRAGAAKSIFHFDVQGSVAKSTHAGLPWLLYLRRHVGGRRGEVRRSAIRDAPLEDRLHFTASRTAATKASMSALEFRSVQHTRMWSRRSRE